MRTITNETTNKYNSYLIWSFKAERKFIDGLGCHSDLLGYKRVGRLSLLQKYKRSINKRRDWSDLDKRLITEYVDKVIERMFG